MENALAKPCEPAENRHASRIHLFVAATLCWDEGSTPVHVRNMSPRGALVEADILPIPGSRIVLKRGSLEAGGRVAWAASRQAGLAFNMSVRETDWMGRRASAHQDRVDEIVTMLKAEAATNKPGQASAERPPRPVDVEAELASLHDDLTKLEDALATDVILVATHPEIQLIDIALQRVGRIMRALG